MGIFYREFNKCGIECHSQATPPLPPEVGGRPLNLDHDPYTVAAGAAAPPYLWMDRHVVLPLVRSSMVVVRCLYPSLPQSKLLKLS